MKWKLLGAAVALAAAGWSAWWFVGAGAREAALEAWLAERRAEGWQAEAASVDTAGFPNRFDTRLTDPALADPAVGWAWSAPFLDVMTLSYDPTGAIVAFPPEQRLSAPGARAVLRSDDLRASLRLRPGMSLALTRASVEGRGLALEGSGWRAEAGAAEAHVQAAEGVANGYRLYLGLEDVALPAALRDRLDPAGRLPATAEALTIDATAVLERPLDRLALEQDPPGIETLQLRAADAQWGPLRLRASGDLSADARGYAEGALDVRAENWREMLRAAVAAGAVGAEVAGLLETGLGLVAALSGGDALEAPLRFSGGRARLGPVAIGAAPRLR